MPRVAFSGALAVFTSILTHPARFHWFAYLGDYTTSMIMDSQAGWVLAGLGKQIPWPR